MNDKITMLMTDQLPRRTHEHRLLFLRSLLDTDQKHVVEQIVKGITEAQIESLKKITKS